MTERIEDVPASPPKQPPGRTVPKVYAAISAVQGELAKTGIGKDSKNDQQGYRFRGIDAVFNALSPLLAKHHLCILPRILKREVVERVTAKGSAIFYTTVEAEFDFVSVEDASRHVVRTFGEAMDTADKSTNKAMSAAYKYAAFQAFAIPTEGDNDADATTHEVTAIEMAPRSRSTRAHTADSAEVTEEQKAELRKIGSSLIDLVNEERENVSIDHSYTMWEMVESMDQDRLLWLSLYLDKHPRVLARLKAVMVEERRKLRAAAAQVPAAA